MWNFIAGKTDRLDRLLREERWPGTEWLSRQAWEALLEMGLVSVNGRNQRKSGASLQKGDKVSVRLPSPSLGLLPADSPAELVWADPAKRWGIFNKSVGLSTYPLLPWETGTLANQVARFLEDQGWMSAQEFLRLAAPPLLEGGIVQRLDRDTSGLLCVACDASTKALFRQLFSQSAVEKTYLALVSGELTSLPGQHTLWLQAQGAKVKAFRECPRGEAEKIALSVSVLQSSGQSALVEVTTCQGARHVVRASLALLGAPLVGDILYGGSAAEPFHQLHAARLALLEPAAFPAFPSGIECAPPQTFLDSRQRLGLH